jgi:hypothetical protein
MNDLFAKCGFNCGHCPTYKENLKTFNDRKRCSNGWAKYFNIKLSPEKLRLCDSCQAPDEEKPTRYLNCYVRKCAVKNGVETCAHCSAFPCEDVTKISRSVGTREEIAERSGMQVPEQDYLAFIEPYEGIKHLQEIRTSLSPKDIKAMTKVSAEPPIINFPQSLPFPSKETKAYKSLHQLIAAIESVNNVSHARLLMLKKRREHMLKLLWAFGLFRKPNEKEHDHLIIDSETYLAQNIHSSYLILKSYFKAFEKYGVQCELVPLKEKEWLTPGGALRKKGWYLNMSFSNEIGDILTLRALQRYAKKLNDKYGKNAFRFFKKADMRVLLQEAK